MNLYQEIVSLEEYIFDSEEPIKKITDRIYDLASQFYQECASSFGEDIQDFVMDGKWLQDYKLLSEDGMIRGSLAESVAYFNLACNKSFLSEKFQIYGFGLSCAQSKLNATLRIAEKALFFNDIEEGKKAEFNQVVDFIVVNAINDLVFNKIVTKYEVELSEADNIFSSILNEMSNLTLRPNNYIEGECLKLVMKEFLSQDLLARQQQEIQRQQYEAVMQELIERRDLYSLDSSVGKKEKTTSGYFSESFKNMPKVDEPSRASSASPSIGKKGIVPVPMPMPVPAPIVFDNNPREEKLPSVPQRIAKPVPKGHSKKALSPLRPILDIPSISIQEHGSPELPELPKFTSSQPNIINRPKAVRGKSTIDDSGVSSDPNSSSESENDEPLAKRSLRMSSSQPSLSSRSTAFPTGSLSPNANIIPDSDSSELTQLEERFGKIKPNNLKH